MIANLKFNPATKGRLNVFCYSMRDRKLKYPLETSSVTVKVILLYIQRWRQFSQIYRIY